MQKEPAPENTIFALDIGTRTVIGLLAVPRESRLVTLAQHMVEHSRRTMRDGQIHDIQGVAQAVREVVFGIEEKTGLQLQKAAIAAAGRSLITKSARSERDMEGREIDWQDVEALTLTALQEAHRDITVAQPQYSCVGHSVLSYYLDDYPMTSLTGHKGRKMGVEVLATFLPDSVVNSLYTVMSMVKLEPFFLTLEPIAAIEAAIPDNFRFLNLALVDIGAGTADIAVTQNGMIISYDMVPLAGDEISEAIMQALLVDFNMAEKVKRELVGKEEILYEDIVGSTGKIGRSDLLGEISPVLDKIATEIAARIIAANGNQAPRCVFLVGGGGQVPGFTEKLASCLNLDPGRVVLRDRQSCTLIDQGKEEEIKGPGGVTVAGIAMVALHKLGHDFLQVMVNGTSHRLFNSGEFNVSSVLGLTGFDPRLLLGKNGSSLHCTLNNKPCYLPGGLARPAEITVNGHQANLKTRVRDGDSIEIRPAQNGENARATIADLCPEANMPGTFCYINGKSVTPSEAVGENDVIEVLHGEKTGSLAGTGAALEITVTVNGQEVTLSGKAQYFLLDIFNYVDIDLKTVKPPVVITLNGVPASFMEELKEKDVIDIGWNNHRATPAGEFPD